MALHLRNQTIYSVAYYKDLCRCMCEHISNLMGVVPSTVHDASDGRIYGNFSHCHRPKVVVIVVLLRISGHLPAPLSGACISVSVTISTFYFWLNLHRDMFHIRLDRCVRCPYGLIVTYFILDIILLCAK